MPVQPKPILPAVTAQTFEPSKPSVTFRLAKFSYFLLSLPSAFSHDDLRNLQGEQTQ
jgi:hypothetical protein